MSQLIKSTLILAFARVTNFALVFFSPILLVRILDPVQFGQYREFIAYSLIVTSLAAFSITTNLLYFVPKQPDKTLRFVSHTNWLTFAMSILACLVLWIFDGQIHASTSFNFLLPLAIYSTLFVNFSFLESYWIATKQAKYVLYFSTTRTIVRLGAVVGTAFLTRSVETILTALVVIELVRVIIVMVIAKRIGLLSFRIDRELLNEQLGFIVPLGLASSIKSLHQYVGQIIISAQLGVVALAVYAIASYKVPIVRIVRGAVSDAIFPDMVRQASASDGDRLRLWKRGNIAYSFLILPIFLLLFWYADVLIPFLFTDKYADAVPIFRMLLLLMPIESIELSSTLRAANRNRELLISNLLLFGVNLVCIAIFFTFVPDRAILGPAVGLVAGSLLQHIYMGWRIIRLYSTSLGEMLKWRSQAAIYLCTAISALILIAGEFAPMNDLLRVLVFSCFYGVVYFLVIRYFRIEEVETVIGTLLRKFHRRRKKSNN